VKRSFLLALSVAGLGLALSLPLLADEKGKSDKECAAKCGCEMVSIDRPFNEVVNQVPAALRDSGLILAGTIDWKSLATAPHGSMPGTPRLEAATKDVRTFFITDEHVVKSVLEKPLHGFWLGKMVIYEQDGKTELAFFKPTTKMEEMKKSGLIPEDKYEEHVKKAQDYERRLEQAINELKTKK